MRGWPRAVSWSSIDVRSNVLSPSEDLLKKWKYHKERCIKESNTSYLEAGWQEFSTELKKEFAENPQVTYILRILRDLSKVSDITLLCEEKDDDLYCHRYLVKELIENE